MLEDREAKHLFENIKVRTKRRFKVSWDPHRHCWAYQGECLCDEYNNYPWWGHCAAQDGVQNRVAWMEARIATGGWVHESRVRIYSPYRVFDDKIKDFTRVIWSLDDSGSNISLKWYCSAKGVMGVSNKWTYQGSLLPSIHPPITPLKHKINLTWLIYSHKLLSHPREVHRVTNTSQEVYLLQLIPLPCHLVQ